MLIANEAIEFPVIHVQSRQGSYPHVPGFVFGETTNVVGCDGSAVFGVMAKYCEGVAIVHVQSIFGSDPHKAVFILVNVTGVSLRKTLLYGKMIESHFLSLYIRRSCDKH